MIRGNVPPTVRPYLTDLTSFMDRQESADGLQLAKGGVESLTDPFPEYTIRWGVVRDVGSGSGSGSDGSTSDSGSGTGGDNPSDSMGIPHAWNEAERSNTMAGEYQLKLNGISGDLPDEDYGSNDQVNMLKNTAWDLSGREWPPGSVIVVMMVSPGEWWIIGGSGEASGSGSDGMQTYTITCGDGSQQTVTVRRS